MSLVRTVSQGAPGGVVLLFYAVGTGEVWFSEYQSQSIVAVAAVIGFLYLLLIELVSDAAIGFVALPIIFSAKEEIDANTGSENFYFDHEDKKSELNDYDDQVFRYTTVLYASIIVALTAPIQGYLYQKSEALLVSVVIALFGAGFSYLSFTNMKKVIDTSVKLYE